MIGVNHISIYSVFLVCLCNLNAIFTPLFLSITLIHHPCEFAGLESKVSKDEHKKSKKGEPAPEALLRQGKERALPRRS